MKSGSSTVRTISPLRKMTPRPLPPAMPMSAIARFAGAVDDAAHDGDRDRLAELREVVLDLVGERDEVDLDAAAGGAGDERRAALAQVQRLEDVPADRHLFDRVGGEGDADRVADAFGEQHADADALRTEPARGVPASVTPRCSG